MNTFARILTISAVATLSQLYFGCSNSSPTVADNTVKLIDTDKDGTPDISDNDIDGDGIANTTDADIDGDGITNTTDPDIDGDGVLNINDNDLDGDGIINEQDPDIDGDGIANGVDPDIDNDGIPNGQDNDIDGDGIPNTIDPDIDGDGTPNGQDTTPDGTGDGTGGTQGTVNTGTDQNTGDNDKTNPPADGIVIEATHELPMGLSFDKYSAGTVVEVSDILDLTDIRANIEDNQIDLPTAYITTATITLNPENRPYVLANSDKRIIVRVYMQDEGKPATRQILMESPDASSTTFPMMTAAQLAGGEIELNKGIYVAMPGFQNYLNLIKNTATPSIEIVATMELVDTLTGPGEIDMTIDVVFAGKKKI
jgi:hypothetical protein